jgi:hypothetical protein
MQQQMKFKHLQKGMDELDVNFCNNVFPMGGVKMVISNYYTRYIVYYLLLIPDFRQGLYLRFIF